MDLRLAMQQCFLLRRKEKTLLISFLLKEKTNGPLPPSQKKIFNFLIRRRSNGPPSCHEAETEVYNPSIKRPSMINVNKS